MLTMELLRKRKTELKRIASKYGATNIRVFGSIARGEADEKSDLDILIEVKRGFTLMKHAGLMLELEELLGCKVDVVVDRSLKPRIKDRVLAEAKPL